MELLWRTAEGQLLSRGAPQSPPFEGLEGASLFDHACDFDRIDPGTGRILEKYRRRFPAGDLKDAWRLTGHVVEAGALIEILFYVQSPRFHGGCQRRALSRTHLLDGLVVAPTPRWRIPDGSVLVRGAPQTTSYGSSPPCALVEDLFDYDVVDPGTGRVIGRHHRSDVLIGASDTEILTRHRIEDDTLVEYVFDYYEDSCWGVGHVRGHKKTVAVSGLVPIASG